MYFGSPNRRRRSRSRSRNRGARFHTQPIGGSSANKGESLDIPTKSSTSAQNLDQSAPVKVEIDKSPYFMIQLAHGSETHTIRDVNSTKQLYQKVLECFPELSMDDILYLTVGTYKPEMNAVVSGQLNFGDLLFVHLRGEKREIELLKTDRLLGMTISDNGNGKAYIKKLRPGSAADMARPAIAEGMHIERLDERNVVGLRHFEVANLLRDIPIGKTVQLRLISPLQSGLSHLSSRAESTSTQMKGKNGEMNGGMTLRFKANGSTVIQQLPDPSKNQESGEIPAEVVAAINRLFEEYIGFSDEELSRSVCELAATCSTPFEMNKKIKESEISAFSFPEELVYDMFGLYSDLKCGRGVRAVKIGD